MKLSTYSLFILVSMVLTQGAQAEIYKWVDDNGETHYSEQKPATGVRSETITPHDVSGRAARPSVAEQDAAFSQQQTAEREAAEKAREAEAEVAKAKLNCDQAQKRVASLERPRVNQVAADGTRTRMPEEWRQSELSAARTAVAKLCPS